MISFSCGECGATFKAKRSMAGRKGKCPRCGAALEVPQPESAEDDGLYALEALADPQRGGPAAAPQAATAAAPAAGGRRCPSCGQPLGAKARLCARCGIKVPSGRPLVTAFEPDLDLIAFDVVYVATRLESNVAHWAHLGGFLAGAAIATALLVARLIPPGANLLSVVFGRYAWPLLGRPRTIKGQ